MRDEVDDHDDGHTSFPPIQEPDLLAASIALRRAMPAAISRALMRVDSVCVIIQVPSAAWCRPVHKVFARQMAGLRSVEFDGVRSNDLPWPVAVYVRDGTERTQGRRDMSGSRLSSHLGQGGTVIAIAADLGLLPPEILVAADRTIAVANIGARDVRGIVRRVTKSRRHVGVDDRLAASVGPADLAMSVRPGSTPAACVARLRRIVDARSAVADVDDVPLLQDLAGYGAAQEWGMSLVRDVDVFRRDPSALPMSVLQRSLLLVGPPGVGKSLYAKVLAKTASIPLIVTSYGDWSTHGTGHLNDVTAAMKLAFSDARAAALSAGSPALLFIDELDSLPNRGALVGGENDGWWVALVNALLTAAELSSPARLGVVLIGATNYESRIDPALRRAGRFDTTIRLRLPDAADLAAILRTHLGTDLPDADLMAIATMAPPSSGADAARWVREARRAARDRGAPMRLDDIVAQVAPPERRPVSFLRAIARHEAAHAVVGMRLGFGRVATVSLVPRGHFAGHTSFDCDEDATPTRATFEANVVTALAGRAADELFGEPNSGAGGARDSDLGHATRLIASVHASYGLGDSFVLLCDPDRVSDLLAHDHDLRGLVEADLRRLYSKAREAVTTHRAAIEAVAEALLVARVMSGAEVQRIADAIEREPRTRPRGTRP